MTHPSSMTKRKSDTRPPRGVSVPPGQPLDPILQRGEVVEVTIRAKGLPHDGDET